MVKEPDLLTAFENNLQELSSLIAGLPPGAGDLIYAPGKWPLKWVLIHLVDTERFYAYRAFCSSRQMDITLEFDPHQDIYARNANSDNRSLDDVAREFRALRESTIWLFRGMTEEMLDYKGFPDKMVYTARSLGWMAVGHNIHHLEAIRHKYLNPDNRW